MKPSEWAQELIENRSVHVPVLWVEDPYAILDNREAVNLGARLTKRGRKLLVVRSAFALRERLTEDESTNGAMIVVDQSCTPRAPHLLPQDCKPQDFVPLAAPDWRPQIGSDGRLALSVREFLIACTGDVNWPAEVNLYPYEALARRRPERFVEACDDFKRSGRALTSEDLRMVGASAVLDEDLFELNNPLTALSLAFHSEARWTELAEYFNPDEIAAIRARLQKLEAPIGHLFGSGADKARLALTSLIVLRQHFPEPASQLAALDPGLLAYQNCEVPLLMEAPAWFVENEVPRFERLLSSTFKQHLFKHFLLDDPKKASEFASHERFSREMRNLAPFEPVRVQTTEAGKENEFEIGRLVSTFMTAKNGLAGAVQAARGGIQSLKLATPARISVDTIKKLFVDHGLCMADSYIGQINAAAQDIEGPAHGDWKDLSGFDKRWQSERREAFDLAAEARGLLNDLDYHFGRLLETRYREITPSEVLSTNHFYPRFIGPRRRMANGQLDTSAILLIDSMRFDLWRRLVLPMLEPEYEIEETYGLASLPSETRVSRRAFFAGKAPGELPDYGAETEFAGDCIQTFHDTPTDFVEVTKRPGMAFAVQSKDRKTYIGTFDFADNLAHAVDWQPHLVQAVLKPILHEIKAVLAEHGRAGSVFITADHGHSLQQGGIPVRIPNSDDVGYRSAYVEKRVEGDSARHLFQISAQVLGHNRPGWFVFPKPGYYLRPEQAGRGRPGDSYRHGGLSAHEVLVPLVCLRHRKAKSKITLTVPSRATAIVGKTSEIVVTVTADHQLSSPVRVVADMTDVESGYLSSVGPNPQTLSLRITPTAPGKHRIKLQAFLGGQEAQSVADAVLELSVNPGKPVENPMLTKLKNILGD